jgi:dihydrofolate synthase/folylpolyglutamate synthase
MTAGARPAFFFEEWSRRGPGDRRSLRRAALLAGLLGVTEPGPPVLTVVGSKGKGTAATYASAWLVAAGCRVVTVTSPGLRRDAERIRVDGAAVSEDELAGLARRLQRASRSLPSARDGYLSPSGLFTLAGLLHAREAGADVVVLEAGMGGVSDEAGLFAPSVLAITEVFGEHLGVLGDTPAEIAADKAGVAARTTSAVVSLPQTPAVAAAIAATVAAAGAGRVETIDLVRSGDPGIGPLTGTGGGIPTGSESPAGNPSPACRTGDDECATDPAAALLPQGLNRPNATLGCTAARRLLDAIGRPAPDGARLARVLASVRLPGRTSWHTVPGATLLIDSAIGRTGAAAAVREAYRRWDRIDHVVACLPDHKDIPGVLAELEGLPVTLVRMPDRESLRFTRTQATVDAAGLTPEGLAALGERILVLGTVYFTGRVLDLIDAPTERLFDA